jgi:hypothetical protein
MAAAIGLIYALGVFLLGAGEFLQGLAALADTEVFRKYFQDLLGQESQLVQGQPLLSEDAEALYVEFAWQKDLQYQLTVLKREVLKLPSLPHEGL